MKNKTLPPINSLDPLYKSPKPIERIFLELMVALSQWGEGAPHSPVKKVVVSRSVFLGLLYECSRILHESPGNIHVQNIDLPRRSIQICGIKVECEE